MTLIAPLHMSFGDFTFALESTVSILTVEKNTLVKRSKMYTDSNRVTPTNTAASPSPVFKLL